MLPVPSTAMPPPTLQGAVPHVVGAGVFPPKYVDYAMLPGYGTLVFSLVTKN
jgi:hypothetical protein